MPPTGWRKRLPRAASRRKSCTPTCSTGQLGADAVHQGLLMEAKGLSQPRLDQIEKSGIVVMLDQVTDPHNVGAILRTCAAFNVTALVATARHSPEASAVLFKSASGAYEHVPFVKVTNLSRAMAELKDYGFRIARPGQRGAGRHLRRSTARRPSPSCWGPRARACASSPATAATISSAST